jgi:hypothetical protein
VENWEKYTGRPNTPLAMPEVLGLIVDEMEQNPTEPFVNLNPWRIRSHFGVKYSLQQIAVALDWLEQHGVLCVRFTYSETGGEIVGVHGYANPEPMEQKHKKK